MPNPNTAAFPTSVANIPLATDNYSSTLSSGIGAADTYIPVASLPTNASPTVITIDNEVIFAANNNATGFTNCVRGVDGTLGANHSSGNNVYGYVAAYYLNQLAAEVSAIEQAWFTPQAACAVCLSGNIAVSNLNSTLVQWNATVGNRNTPSSMFSGNNNNIVVPSAGLYLAICEVSWDANNTGGRQINLNVVGYAGGALEDLATSANGTGTLIARQPQRIDAVLYLNANATISASVIQSSGANLNMQGGLYTSLAVTKIL
jgi:hypothetical protein